MIYDVFLFIRVNKTPEESCFLFPWTRWGEEPCAAKSVLYFVGIRRSPIQLAESWGKIMTETKLNKWKLLPCMTIGSECFLTQLHVNIPLSFPNEVSEIRDNFFHCWLLITVFIEDAVQSLHVVLCLHTRRLQNVFSLQEENVQCKNVSAAMETIRLSESSEAFSGKLFGGFLFFFNSPHEILDSF